MVPVNHQGPDAGIREFFQPVPETDLGAKAVILPVIDVACHQQEIHSFFETQFYDLVEGLESRGTKRCGERLVMLPNGGKGAVQMKISGVNEGKGGHEGWY